MPALVTLLACAAPARAADAICAQVKIELQQTLVITRTAFRATLTLDNGTASEFVSNVRVTLDIRDTSDTFANDRFNTQTLVLTGIGNIDGSGVVPPLSVATAQWTIIPYRTAAPTGPVEYDFGATLEYTLGDEYFEIPLFPKRLTVYPDPFLEVKYFWQRDVYADNPFTENIVEPSEPFSLGLMITNNGAGPARNLRITSGQPKIIENQRGLLIGFQVIGTQVGGREQQEDGSFVSEWGPVSPSLTVNFGDLEPNATGISRFLMTSSLEGKFIEYSVTYEHVTGLGDPQLSLIDSVRIRELIHVVQAETPGSDPLPDFLVNQRTWYVVTDPASPWENPPDPYETDPNNPDLVALPDFVYFSDGATAFVTPVLAPDGVSVTIDQGNSRAFATAALPGGWAYIKFPDPFNGQLTLTRVERLDGSEVRLFDNAWQTNRTFAAAGVPPVTQHRIHLFDFSSAATSRQYTLFYTADTTNPTIAKWESLATHGGGLGAELPLVIDISGQMTEPRAAGIHKLAVYFSEPIRAESFGIVNVYGLRPDGSSVPFDPNSIQTSLDTNRTRGEITFDPPLTDFVRYCIRVQNVTDTVGNPLMGGDIVITALMGDVFHDRRTNNTDVGALSSLVGTDPIDPANEKHIRADLNGDGKIDQADVDIALASRGHDARFIAPPCPLREGENPERSAIPEPTLTGPGD